MLTCTSGESQKALKLLRAYSKLVSSPQWPKNWRLYKQWVIHRCYAKLLVDLYRKGSYSPENNDRQWVNCSIHCWRMRSNPDQNCYCNRGALEELTQLLDQFRKILTTLSTQQISPKTLARFTVNLANIIIEAHDIIGWGTATNVRRVLQVYYDERVRSIPGFSTWETAFLQFLYRAKEWTFNTTCIVRYMLLALIRLGDHAEAVHAFNAYLTLIGIPDLLKSDTDDLPNPSIASAKIKKKLGLLHRVDDADEVQQDKTITDIINTLLVGAELFGKGMENGKNAAIIASVVLDLCENEDQLDSYLRARCYQVAGVSYGSLGAQSMYFYLLL